MGLLHNTSLLNVHLDDNIIKTKVLQPTSKFKYQRSYQAIEAFLLFKPFQKLEIKTLYFIS